MKTYTLLTGKNDTSLDKETIEYNDTTYFVKEFVRKYRRHSAAGNAQKLVYKQFTIHGNCDIIPDGITVLDTKRSLGKLDREEALAAQGYVCAIDGKPLELDDAVFGHDTPWSQGGKSVIENGAMVRSEHNRNMGTLTLDEYKMI